MEGFQQFTGFNDRYDLTVKLHRLAGHLAEVVNDNRLDGQLGDVCRVRAVQFRPKDLGKITQLIPRFPEGLDYLFIPADTGDAGR